MTDLTKQIPRIRSDNKQYQKLQRMKESDRIRAQRIFNANQRLMGLDVEALNKQVEENKIRKKLQKEAELTFYNQSLTEEHLGDKKLGELEQQRKQIAKDIDHYRLNDQKKEFSREFDLFDPKVISQQVPQSFEDGDDPRLHTSGTFLRFDSEDYDGNHKKMMKNHFWQSVAKQISENYSEKRTCNLASQKETQDVIELDKYMNKCIEEEEMLRKRRARIVMEYNLDMAEYEREKRKSEKQQDLEDERRHFETISNSDIFNYNEEKMKSALSRGKLRLDHTKGLLPEDKQEISKIQLRQIEEIKDRRKVEKADAKYWLEMQDLMSKVKYSLAHEETVNRKETCRQVFEENVRLAGEQAVQKEYRTRMAKDNMPTDEFYNYFNKSTR